MPPEQGEAVLLHELAHVRRGDYLVNLLQRWIAALFFYHPAVWWMSGVVGAERENCCDDIAVAACGNRSRYAQALAAIEQSRFAPSPPALAASAGPLAKRIRRILIAEADAAPRGAILGVTILSATAMLAFAGWQQTQAPVPATGGFDQVWRKWLNEEVVYIINAAERAAFEGLTTGTEREAFVQQFWQRRGAAAKDEHYRRIAYATSVSALPFPVG